MRPRTGQINQEQPRGGKNKPEYVGFEAHDFFTDLGHQSHTMNTNRVDTLLRQLGEERVDGKGASRKGILENKPF